jgi:hypothetical protein
MWNFWNSNKVEDITNVMSEQLASQYSLGEDKLKGLRYASKAGKFVGQKATYVRIFAPALLKKGVNLDFIRRYDDLSSRVDAVLFESRLAGGRLIDVFDRRPVAVELPYIPGTRISSSI